MFEILLYHYHWLLFPGKAFNSKFIFRCIDWKDESRRRTRDLTTDSLFLYSYTFTFSYQVVDHVEQPKIPVFQVKAPMGKTPGLVLPPGKADFNYKVNIIIDIVDQEEAETNVILEVQVRIILVFSDMANCTYT